ncbi:hypothetical protein [Corynebacterium ulcerans]|uniref:hypothetical protein n=1 Tax=Corynebacterium ulcerans TaxID=65058 RepID=UPI00124BAE07|nr:hypothetical protein [Corynebacterium ulcerans]
MNAKVDEPLRQWLKKDEFLRSGPSVPRGLDDIALIQRLEGLDVDAVITSDIKQMRSPDRTLERAQYRSSGIHWIGVPQSYVRGRSRPFVQAANLLSVIHHVRAQLEVAQMPLAIELKRGFKDSGEPIAEKFPI